MSIEVDVDTDSRPNIKYDETIGNKKGSEISHSYLLTNIISPI